MQIDRTADTIRVTLTAEEAEAVRDDLGQIWAGKVSAAGDQLHSLLECATGDDACDRCAGTGVDPEHVAHEDCGDTVREIPEPCAACQLATPAV